MKRIAIIPARSGSKGLKDKNIIDLCGKPLLAYSIEAATQSNKFERVIVSTDSILYANIAKEWGAEVMMRSAELSSDTASTYDVLQDLLKQIVEQFDYFMLLQPTSPLRNVHHVLEAIMKFESRFDFFDFLASVKDANHPRVLVNSMGDDESLKSFDIDYSRYRRQDYHDVTPNGAIYIAKPAAYLKQKHFYGPKCLAYLMNEYDSVDIDGALDLEIAKLLLNNK